MAYRSISPVFVIIISLYLAQAGIFKNDDQFELREGNCSNVSTTDLVFQDHVSLPAMPYTYRTAILTWAGEQKIFCVMALNPKAESEGSTVYASEGGVDTFFVTVKMRSATNHSLEYDIQVFAK